MKYFIQIIKQVQFSIPAQEKKCIIILFKRMYIYTTEFPQNK